MSSLEEKQQWEEYIDRTEADYLAFVQKAKMTDIKALRKKARDKRLGVTDSTGEYMAWQDHLVPGKWTAEEIYGE